MNHNFCFLFFCFVNRNYCIVWRFFAESNWERNQFFILSLNEHSDCVHHRRPSEQNGKLIAILFRSVNNFSNNAKCGYWPNSAAGDATTKNQFRIVCRRTLSFVESLCELRIICGHAQKCTNIKMHFHEYSYSSFQLDMKLNELIIILRAYLRDMLSLSCLIAFKHMALYVTYNSH